MGDHKKSGVKAIRNMSFKEQLAALAKDPRFRELVDDVNQLSPARRDSLEKELDMMDSESDRSPLSENCPPPASAKRGAIFNDPAFPTRGFR